MDELPLGAVRVFRKFSRVTGEKAPGAPGPEFPAAAGGGFSVGAPQLEAYLSTHPLDDERVRNVSALTSALERLKQYTRLPPNGLALFCGTVAPDGGKERRAARIRSHTAGSSAARPAGSVR